MKTYIKRDEYRFFEEGLIKFDSGDEWVTLRVALNKHIEFMETLNFHTSDDPHSVKMYKNAVDAFNALDIQNALPLTPLIAYNDDDHAKKDVLIMPFEPLSVASRGGNAVTIDKFHRLRLSSSALKALAVTQFTPVVVSVDPELKRVGIVKQDLAKIPNASTVRPDKRGYLGTAIGKKVCDKLALTDADIPAKFEYVGKVDEGSVFWHAFELAK